MLDRSQDKDKVEDDEKVTEDAFCVHPWSRPWPTIADLHRMDPSARKDWERIIAEALF